MSISFYKNDKMNGEVRFLSQHASPYTKYYWNGMLVDNHFTRRKKTAWLALRKRLDSSVHDKHANILSLFIISDLIN